MNETAHEQRIAFLLGAGASVEAGLPTLQSLSTAFFQDLEKQHPSLHQSLVLWFPAAAGSHSLPDAEQLLGYLERVIEWPHPALEASRRDAAILQHELRKFIWATLGRHRRLDYLDPLQHLLATNAPLEIFSLNNDMVIEEWCRRRGVSYCDGFNTAGEWHIRAFEQPELRIRLFKLHGSINWYRDQNTDMLARAASGRRVALALRVARTAVPDVALLFPAHTKDILQPPLLTLFHLFQQKLAHLELLVVAGCSLRDLHISRALRQAMVQNENLHVLLVDPDPTGRAVWQIVQRLPALEPRVRHHQATFGAFLQEDLTSVFVEVFQDRKQVAVLLERALSRLATPEAVTLLRQASQKLAMQALALPDRQQLATIVKKNWPLPPQVESPLTTVHTVLQKISCHDNPAALLEQASTLLADYPQPSCFGIALQGQYLFIISGSSGRLRRYDLQNWRSEELGPAFTNARGLAVAGNIAYVVQCWFAGFEGAGVIYMVDLHTQQCRRLFPERWFLADLAGRFARAQAATSLTSKMRELAGLLNWPSAIRPLQDNKKAWVIEARRLRLIELTSGRTLALSPPRFFNLVDAVEWNYPEMIVLEAARAGAGNLAWYDCEQDKLEPIVRSLHAPAGVALLPNRRDLLCTISLPRPDGKLLLVRDFQNTPQTTLVLEQLNKPRHLAVSSTGDIYLASRDGVMRLKAGVII